MRNYEQRWLTVIAALTSVAALAGCGSTKAGHRTTRGAAVADQFQTAGFLATNGDPVPALVAYGGGAGPLRWSMCAPGGRRCTRLASTHGLASPGAQPAGTVFRFTSTFQHRGYSSTLTWHGPLHVAKRPSLTGDARVGATAGVSGADWTGGWGGGRDALGIEACRRIRGGPCVMLLGAALTCSASVGCGELGDVPRRGSTPLTSARVGNWYTGWYLFALDAHLGNPTSLLVGFQSEAAIKPWPINATIVRSRPYGPVIGPRAPTVVVLPRAQKRGRQVLVASVSCTASCPVRVSVETKHPSRDNRIEWTRNERVRGERTIGVSGALPAGRAAVTVQVGNGPYVKGRSLIR